MPNRKRQVDRVLAVELYHSGLSLEAVGRQFGVTGGTILNRFKDWGVTRRGSGDLKRGKPHTTEHRAKIGLANYGKRLSEVTKQRISAKAKGRTSWNRGLRKSTHPDRVKYGKAADSHWNWQGGISAESIRFRQSSEYKAWRDAVFRRDNYTCQECYNDRSYLEADHIKPFATYPELRLEVSNGRTLCRLCHKVRTRQQRRNGEINGGACNYSTRRDVLGSSKTA